MNFSIKNSPQKILVFFVASSFLLNILSLAITFLKLSLKIPLQTLTSPFDVGLDSSIPTWYSSLTLLLCAALLIFIGHFQRQKGDKYARHWFILGILFLGFSVDEVARIHERSEKLINLPALGGFLHYQWVVFGIVLVFLTGFYYLNFLKNLPPDIRGLFILSATLFIGGALGIEILNSRQHYLEGAETILYVLGTSLEELCEMLGVAFFLFSLTTYLKKYMGVEVVAINTLNKSQA